MIEQSYPLLQQRVEQAVTSARITVLQWLLDLSVVAQARSKQEIDAALAEERDW